MNLKESRFANLIEGARDFLAQLLAPEGRLSASEALEHPWIDAWTTEIRGGFTILHIFSNEFKTI